MASGIFENWPLLFTLAWLAGAFGLWLLFPTVRVKGGTDKLLYPKFKGSGRASGACYVKLDYRIPARSGRSLAKAFGDSPDVRAVYVRSEFLLSLGAGLRPDEVLHKWLASNSWKEEREQFAINRQDASHTTLSAVRRGDVRRIYRAPKIAPEKPLALNFPLLPPEFCIFVGTRFAALDEGVSRTFEQGMYSCQVVDWREEDGYASRIACEDMRGIVAYIDQTSLREAIMARRAVIEGVYFAGLPLHKFVSKSYPLPRLQPEQKAAQKLALRMPSPRDYINLDTKLLKLMGGINPINLVRLSRFYHPVTGLKPDGAKYNKLVGKARDAGLSLLKR